MQSCRAAVIVLTFALTGCTAPKHATRVLSEQGYTEIRAGGYDWLGCGRDDDFATKFTALSPAGKPVRGVVCSGWWKGSTIRLY